MSGISTHVLDTAKGRPASGIAVLLERFTPESGWERLGEGITDQNGRIAHLSPEDQPLDAGAYRITFRTAPYFGQQESFYPEVSIQFRVNDPASHYHIPLLLSPHGYTTYRGS
jgi:5-hydroxyisourate hydrolase